MLFQKNGMRPAPVNWKPANPASSSTAQIVFQDQNLM